MDKALCFGALGVGALIMLVMFLLDLVAGVPFGGKDFMTGDIFGLLASYCRGLPRLERCTRPEVR